MKVKPIRDHIIVTDMNFKERLSNGGIVLMDDDKKSEGIRPRWARVYAVGHDQLDVTAGQYVLVAHGRWTRGVKITEDDGTENILRRVDNNDILLVSDEEQADITMGIVN